MASTDLDTTTAPVGPSAPRRRRRIGRFAVLLVVVPALFVTSCKPGRVIEDVIEDIGNIFGIGDNEIATPEFEITNGIKIRVVIKATDAEGGLPVVVHVRCAGGTDLAQTVVLQESGDLSLGETTFEQGWPLGADCIVSQEIVQNVEVVRSTITWVNDNLVRADFLNV